MPLRRRALLALPGLAAARPAPAAEGTTLLFAAEPDSASALWPGAFAPFLERQLRRAGIRPRNLPGEGGLRAARALAAAPGDGRWIGAFSLPGLILRALEQDARPLLASLRLAGCVARAPLVLVAAPGPEAGLAALRARRDGVLATPPAGGLAALSARRLAALPLSLLAFPSAAAARQAARSGHAAAALLSLPAALPGLRAGWLAGLGIAEAARLDLLPDLPTLAEQGVPLVAAQHRALLLPGHASAAEAEALSAALAAIAADAEFAAQAAELGYVPEDHPAGQGWMERETALWEQEWEAAPWTGGASHLNIENK